MSPRESEWLLMPVQFEWFARFISDNLLPFGNWAGTDYFFLTLKVLGFLVIGTWLLTWP